MRAALLLLLVLLMALLAAGAASAAEPEPAGAPPTIGPVPALPPPPPALPKPKGAKKGAKPPKHAGKHAGRSSKGQGGKEAKGGSALDLHASCAPLTHTQTYSAWGPAVSYGQPVTVVYEAARCSTPDGSALDVSAEGTATIFAGASDAGELLDTRPFVVTGTWRLPRNDAAWPPAWWDCSVSYASYTWQIPGVYTFLVSARDGVWSLDVSSRGVGSQDLSWTHDGCA